LIPAFVFVDSFNKEGSVDSHYLIGEVKRAEAGGPARCVPRSVSLRPIQTGGRPLIERRTGKRFDVNWPVKIEGGDGNHVISGEGRLLNISSGGALVDLAEPVCQGMRLDVYIKLPFKKDNWMKYAAEVLRVEAGASCRAAVKFAGARPHFG
jgi:PilZ domain